MRKLASIRTIKEIVPIANADKIELAKIDGWQVVVGKGEFKVGDLVVYLEIDSALPVDDERYLFLHERCRKTWLNHGQLVADVVRIKTIKLRGQISQGLCIPINKFPEIESPEVGLDVTELLRVEHYDELAEKCGRIQGTARIAGNAKGNFPSHLVPKTDEERIQNLTDKFEEWNEFWIRFQATEKADGTSFTFIYAPVARPEDPYFICSRNLELKDSEDNLYWNMARKYNLFEVTKRHCEWWNETDYVHQVAVQMEIVGPGVNGNRDNLTEHQVRVFRIYNVSGQAFYDPQTCQCVAEEMGLPHCKVLKDNWQVFEDMKTVDDFLEYVKGKTDNGNEREGVVFKAVNANTKEYISFKCINNDYLLKEK